jgi:hypothetical protein
MGSERVFDMAAKRKIISWEDEARKAKSYKQDYRDEAAQVRGCLAGLSGRQYLLMLGFLEANAYDVARADGAWQLPHRVARCDYISELLRLVSDAEWCDGTPMRGADLYWQGKDATMIQGDYGAAVLRLVG